jgi:SAM-dependent methyltransferase
MQQTVRDGAVPRPSVSTSNLVCTASVESYLDSLKNLSQLDYEWWLSGSTESAEVAVPLILAATEPRSVVDVGCGLGQWLTVFKRHGVEDVLGYDGPWIDRSQLLVAPAEFVGADLNEPLPVGRRFDLALCLEVVHMLEPERAAPVVASLVELADVVVFSAGVPGQGGTLQQNEQWPAYWAGLFAEHGYVVSDPFRAALWEEPEVKWWFAQNMLCYATPEAAEARPALAASRCEGDPRRLVHPGCLEQARWELEEAKREQEPSRWARLLRLQSAPSSSRSNAR